MALSTRPGSITTSSLLCKHGLLKYSPHPIDLVNDPGFPLPGISSSVMVPVQPDAWQRLLLRYKLAGPEIRVTYSKRKRRAGAAAPGDVTAAWADLQCECEPAVCADCLLSRV